MLNIQVASKIKLVIIEKRYAEELQALYEEAQDLISKWIPAVEDMINDRGKVENLIDIWLDMFSKERGYFFFIKFEEKICGIYQLEIIKNNQNGELSCWMSPYYHKNGLILLKCTKKIIHLAFTEFKLNKIVARTSVDNIIIWKGLEKLGFKKEGELREDYFINNSFQDMYLYSILQREWQDQNNKFYDRININI